MNTNKCNIIHQQQPFYPKVITPFNFQYPTKYPCIICYQRCSQPISCNQCKQIICFKHIQKIRNKCPNCRLNPFKYQKDQFIKKLVENEIRLERDILISKATFTCLVEGCNFQGKYHKMDIHRRKNHRNEQLKDILFTEQREKKRKKQILQKLFIKILIRKQHQLKLSKKANQIYQKMNKKISLQTICQMIWHVSECSNQKCKQVYAEKQMCFVGDLNKQLSDCDVGKTYLFFVND